MTDHDQNALYRQIAALRAERDRAAEWESFVRPLLRQISDALNIARDEESPGLQCGFLDAIEAIKDDNERLRGLIEEAYREGFTADHDNGLHREWLSSDARKGLSQ